MGSKTPEEHYRRLSEAVDLYLQHRTTRDGEAKPAPEDLLAQHPELGDLLTPLLANVDPEIGVEPSDSPRFFGDYELLREVGRGGMGVVFEALEVALQRRVALKVLPNRPGTSVNQVERFRREAAAAGRLQHPGIAAVHRVGEHDGTHFIAMEFVNGPNLATALQQLCSQRDQGACPGRDVSLGLQNPERHVETGYYAEVVDLTAGIAEALAYAHENGVVHRDVKPHNILLGGPSGLKLVDFGLAKDFDREALTRTGDTAGTPDYMSPEQVRSGAIDARTDVYSLGVVLYELLTWERPFSRDAMHATLAAIVNQEAVSARKLQPHTPRDLDTICAKAMEKEPSRRYPSAMAMAEDLRRFRRHEPIQASPPSAASRAVKLWRRNRAKTMATVFALLALVVLPIGFAIYFKHSRDALQGAQTETVRQRDRAGEILIEARKSLDEIYSWLADDRLKAEPGLVDVRRELMQRALGFYDRFRELAGAEPLLRVDAVIAEWLFGTILAELGELERADKHLSLELLQSDLQVPRERQFDVAMARLHAYGSKIAILSNLSRTKQAEDLELLALALLEDLSAAGPKQKARRLHEMASLRAHRARRLIEYSTNWQGALQELDHAIKTWDEAAALRPPTVASRIQLASALGERAVFRVRNVGPDDALADCERAVSLLEAVRKERPRSAAPRRRLVRVLGQQSEILIRGKDGDAAVASCQRAVSVAEGIRRDYPEIRAFRAQHISATFDLARAYNANGDAHGCLKHLEIAWPLACALAKEAPGVLAASSLVGNIAGPLAVLRRTLKGQTSAQTLPLHVQAIDVFDAAFIEHPESDVLRDLLGLALATYGNELRHAGHLAEARTVLARAFALQVENLKLHAESQELVMQVRSISVRRIDVELSDGKLQAGYEAAVQLVEVLAGNAHATYDAAEFMAKLASAANADPEHRDRFEAWRSLSFKWLRQAISQDAELIAPASKNKALALFAEDAEFKALLSGQ